MSGTQTRPLLADLGETMTISPRHSVSLALIARDEERCLARCLASARALVDEIVLVDTGSTDRTVEIARAHGAQVHTLAWRDDFAAARNAALDHTIGDWVLMLDADEWLLPGAAETLAELRATAPDFVGEIEVVSTVATRTLGGDGETTASGWIPRLLPRGVRWAGRIHEQPDWEGPLRRTALSAGHDGYAPAQLTGKRGRNATLLRAELAARPRDPYLLTQLGRALESDGEYGGAVDAYSEALPLTPIEAPARHDLVVRLLFSLGQSGQTSVALELAEIELPRWADSPDLHFCIGDLLLSHGLAHPEAGDQVLPVIERLWLRCLELGERPELVGAVAGRGSHLAAHNLAVLYDSTGDQARAEEFRRLSRDLRPLK